MLTPPDQLGPESTGEHSLAGINDFDDFNGQIFEKEIPGSGKRFRSSFRVYYVDPFDITHEMPSQTWVKRMDVRTWQSSPPLTNPTAADTLTTFVINGYYHFN